MRWRIRPSHKRPPATLAPNRKRIPLEIIPVPIRSEVEQDDDIVELINQSGIKVLDGDILVISQKIVSKQEGRTVSVSAIIPSILAQGIASEYGKDPRLVEAILSESKRIVRMHDGVIITETRNGIVCANAGIDESNVPKGMITLLPMDPDRSARWIRSGIKKILDKNTAVLISDTFGRPLRMGQTDCAIGVSGMQAIRDYRGMSDKFGRELRVTAIAVADEICAAAELVMGKTSRCPVAIVRNYAYADGDSAASLSRPRDKDLFQ